MKPKNKSRHIDHKYIIKGIKKVKIWFFKRTKRIDNLVTRGWGRKEGQYTYKVTRFPYFM